MSLLQHLQSRALRHPRAAAMADDRGWIDAATLWRRVQAAAEHFRAIGVRRVASQLDNGVDAVVLDLALREAGVVHIPLPGFHTDAQKAAAEAAVGADARVLAGPGDARAGHWRIERLAETADVSLPQTTQLVTFTSGSTGDARGVCLSAAHLDAVAGAIVDALAGFTPQRHLCLLPLAVLLEQVAGVHAALLADAPVLLPPLRETGLRGAASLDPRTLADCIDRHAPESLILVPQMLQGWLAALACGARAPASLRFAAVGGARVGGALLSQAAVRGLPVHEGYGLSECGSVVCLNTPAARREGSVGRPLPHLRLEVDAEREIVVHGPHCLGYVGEPAPPRGAWRTGDLGTLDADGFLRIDGRRRNVYITAFGRNVSPEWIESELTQHPLIAQAVVDGEARTRAAAIIAPRRADASDAELAAALAAVNAGLPDYARVHLWLRAAAPFEPANGLLTANGRVRRAAVLSRYADALERLHESPDSRGHA